jgi:hypothetical protein
MKNETNYRQLVRNATSFAEAVESLKATGMSAARSIMFARNLDSAGFNQWMQDRIAGRIPERTGGSGSIMRHFKFIGG